MSDSLKDEPKKQNEFCCANCDLYSRKTDTHGRCEFWKSMDVMPAWMEGEKIPTHTVSPEDGKDCEAFIPKDDGAGDARREWLLSNLTNLN
ncbi:MAG: hypothetical protein ACM3Q4_13905 [Acidobacteriota bacterium]